MGGSSFNKMPVVAQKKIISQKGKEIDYLGGRRMGATTFQRKSSPPYRNSEGGERRSGGGGGKKGATASLFVKKGMIRGAEREG